MEIGEAIARSGVLLSLKAKSKRHLLEELAGSASAETGVPQRGIFDVLRERERLGTTGVGGGVAVPHAKLEGLGRLYSCFARLDEPVDFEAVDSEPVDLVFLLLAPQSGSADHLKMLGRVSRVLRDRATCDRLRSAPSEGMILDLLSGQARTKAA